MALTDGQKNISLNSIAATTKIENEFIGRLESTFRKLERQLTDLLAQSEGLAAVDIALARNQIEQVLLNTGYFEVTTELLNEGYQAVINESYEQYLKLYNENFQFSEVSLEQLNALKNLDLQQFNQLSGQALTETTRLLTDVSFGSITPAQAIQALREQVIDKLERHAKTWINTGISSIHRQANVLLAQDNGIEKFQYVGTLINTSRDFCKTHLGEIKTAKEWNALDNGQLSPVMTYGGGWNCRHSFVGVVDGR